MLDIVDSGFSTRKYALLENKYLPSKKLLESY